MQQVEGVWATNSDKVAPRFPAASKRQLEGAPDHVNLPLRGARAAVRDYRPGFATIELSDTLFDDLAADRQLPVQTVWLAAWTAFLHRYTLESDLLIGVPSRRTAQEARALRVRVHGDDSLNALMERCRDVLVGALGEVPLAELAECRPGVDPVFHAGFFVNDAPAPSNPASWWRHADVTLVCRRLEPASVELVYNAELISSETATHMAGHLATLLRHALLDPDRPISALRLLSDDERSRIVGSWNETDDQLPHGRSLPERLAELARNSPGAAAVVADDESLSFAELNQGANRLAAHLGELGLEQGARVALCLERSVASVVAQMGIVKAGGAVLFLDPTQPDARIEALMTAAGAKFVITRAGLLDRFSGKRHVICCDRDAALIAACSDADPSVPSAMDSPVLAAGTSGSTGEPKIVLCRHRALENSILWAQSEFGLGVGDRATWLSSPGYGISQLEWWTLLASGATIYLADDKTVGSPEALRDWYVRNSITHTLVMTPLAVRLWTLTWPSETALAVMQVAGERLREWPPTLPFEIMNVYGSAEATLVATCRLSLGPRSIPESERDGRSPPVGRPVSNVRTYILDKYGNPVPPGVVGELFIAGEGLALGYTDAELTANKFGPIDLPEEPSSFVFRTGDLARYWRNGVLDICGRADGQVKIRGSRVELGEVEKCLLAQPHVRDVVVVDKEGPSGDKRLVAYVVGVGGQTPPAHVLRAALEARLPTYMVPSAFVMLDALPLLSSGKINRKALPEPPRHRPDLPVPWRGPSGAFEETLCEIWSRVLRIDDVGVEDGFFDLGGDSLVALSAISLVKERFSVELPLVDFLRNISVRELARQLERAILDGNAHRHESAELRLEHDAASRHEPFALSDMQQALSVGRGGDVELGSVGCHAYFEYDSVDLDVPRLQRAWRRLVARHDMLRAVFDEDGTQRVLAEVPDYVIPVVDVSAASPEVLAETLEQTRERMSHQVLAADRWPLFELRVVKQADRARLYISLDLLVLDAWSYFQILMPELIELYEDPERHMAPLKITFRDYIVATQARLEQTDAYRRAREYWLERLPSLPPAATLPQVEAPAGQELKFVSRGYEIDKDRWSRIKARGRGHGVTPSVIVVAAFAEVLRAWGNSEEFTINFPLFDRMPLHPDINQIVGDFTNTLLVAVTKSDGTFSQRARDIQEQLWRDLEHRQFGGVRVLRELMRSKGGVVASAPIVVTSLLGHPPRRDVANFGREIHAISQTPQVLLDFQVREIEGRLKFNWDSLDARFPQGMLDDMFAAYCGVLDELDGDTSWAEHRFRLVPAHQLATRAQVNATQGPVTQALLHELFMEQALAHPQLPALITSRRTLSFAELAERVNRVARGLRSAGARPNEFVAIVMERGWQQYLGVYAVLASGAAYLPIDPSWPEERRALLMDEARVRLVLTQSTLKQQLTWPASTEVLDVEHDFEAFDSAPLDSVQSSTDLAYVIYTSGSTGKPKGVMIAHASVTNLLNDSKQRFGVGAGDRGFGISSLHFDLSVFDMFSLALGMGQVIPDPSAAPDPGHWLELVQREGVTFWSAVPALTELFISTAESAAVKLPAVRWAVMSGDFIPVTLPDRIRAIAPNVRLWSAGGPTETTVWSIQYEIGDVNPAWTSIPYGKPTLNQKYHILDRELLPRPVWVAGDMYCESEVGLARGYFRDEAMTATRFVTLPNGRRAHATGDVGRYLPDGNIEILGRNDFQVKIHGRRIELGEIEATLVEQPGVRAAVVVVARGANGAKSLAAFVVADPGMQTNVVLAALEARLPSYMVPKSIVELEKLPLSANGKVDRRRLTDIAETDGERPSEGYVAPRNPLEQLLADLIADVLAVDRVGVLDNFFELGGDSISATRFNARVQELLGLKIAVGTLFTRPTVEEVARDLSKAGGAELIELSAMLQNLPLEELNRTLATVRAEA